MSSEAPVAKQYTFVSLPKDSHSALRAMYRSAVDRNASFPDPKPADEEEFVRNACVNIGNADWTSLSESTQAQKSAYGDAVSVGQALADFDVFEGEIYRNVVQDVGVYEPADEKSMDGTAYDNIAKDKSLVYVHLPDGADGTPGKIGFIHDKPAFGGDWRSEWRTVTLNSSASLTTYSVQVRPIDQEGCIAWSAIKLKDNQTTATAGGQGRSELTMGVSTCIFLQHPVFVTGIVEAPRNLRDSPSELAYLIVRDITQLRDPAMSFSEFHWTSDVPPSVDAKGKEVTKDTLRYTRQSDPFDMNVYKYIIGSGAKSWPVGDGTAGAAGAITAPRAFLAVAENNGQTLARVFPVPKLTQ